MTKKIDMRFEYAGYIDYWGGNRQRWEDNKACLFASYHAETTMKELIDELVNDFVSGGDTDGKAAFNDITSDEMREAIVAELTPEGKADYDSDEPCEFAKRLDKWVKVGDDWVFREEGREDIICEDYPQLIVLITVTEEED